MVALFDYGYEDYTLYSFPQWHDDCLHYFSAKPSRFLDHANITYFKECETPPILGSVLYDGTGMLSEVTLKGNFKLGNRPESVDYIVWGYGYKSLFREVDLYLDYCYKRLIVLPVDHIPRIVINNKGQCISLDYKELHYLGKISVIELVTSIEDYDALKQLSVKPLYSVLTILKYSETPEHDLTVDFVFKVAELLSSSDSEVYTLGINLLLSTNFVKFQGSITFLLNYKEFSVNVRELPPILQPFRVNPRYRSTNKEDYFILKALINKYNSNIKIENDQIT